MYEKILENASKVSKFLDILSHEKRLCMLCLISEGPKNISELTKILDISQSLVSQFALKMKDQWILKSEKKGKEVYYELLDTQIIQLLSALKNIYC